MRWTKPVTVLAGLALASTMLLGGCAAKDDMITAKDVRGKTPELATMTRSEGQLKNLEARVINSYLRGLRTDINTILLLDDNNSLNYTTLP